MSTRSPTRPKRRIALAVAQLLLPDANPQRMEIDNFHELPIDPQTPYTASASDQIYQIIIIAMIISIIKFYHEPFGCDHRHKLSASENIASPQPETR